MLTVEEMQSILFGVAETVHENTRGNKIKGGLDLNEILKIVENSAGDYFDEKEREELSIGFQDYNVFY